MRIDVLNELWASEHPGGYIHRSRTDGRFDVTYCADGKEYSFCEHSVFGLAERLDVIPEVDVVTVAGEVVQRLARSEEYVIAPLGAGDTARVLWYDQGYDDGQQMIDCVPAGLDKYGRALGKYSLVDRGGW